MEGGASAAGTPPGDADLAADVTQAARRLRHRLSLVATLPAVRRLRNFLNPNSRLPESCGKMTLLGCSYDRVPPAPRGRGSGLVTTQPGSEGPSDDIVTGHGERGEDEATGPGGDDEANEEGTAEAREEGSQQRATGGERQETRAGAAMKHVVEGIRARFGRPGAGEGSPGQPTASPSPRVTDRPAASPRFGGVFTPQASNANAQGLGDDDDPGLRSFVDDFHSRVWITYRRGFPQIGGSTYTTDAGWGCTLRSGQMLLANSLQTHFFGRQWRWEPPPPRSSVAALTDGTGTPASTDGTATGFGAGVGAGAAAGVASLLQRWDSGWNGAGRDGREGVTEVPLSGSDTVSGSENAGNSDVTHATSSTDGSKTPPARTSPADAAHVRLLGWFGDHPDRESCPFSIHSIVDDWGGDKPSVAAGRWLGPCVLAQGLAALVNSSRPGGVAAHVVAGKDGGFGGGAPTLYKSLVLKVAEDFARKSGVGDGTGDAGRMMDLPGAPFSAANGGETDPGWAPMVILVPLVLGLDRCVNPRYVPGIVRMLSMTQSVGILGGKPCASLYFVGAQEQELFYLDPHTVQVAVPLEQIWGCAQTGSPESGSFPAETYHCQSVLHMNARELDPSMVLGFYCRTRADFDSLCLELELLATRAGSTPILTVAPGPPPWDSDSDSDRGDAGAGSDEDWELV